MPAPQLALPQQFGRFLLAGAVVFALVFWISSWFLMSSHDVHDYIAVVQLLLKGLIHQPPAVWFRDMQTGYVPYFLRQPPLLACYAISAPLAWLAAFLYDSKILRKENTL